MPTPAAPRSAPPAIALAAVLDLLLIGLFAWLGRGAHTEEMTFTGLLGTAWPFLSGALVGWLLARAWRAPFAVARSGLVVWACSLVIGMLLRLLTGAGTALPFVLVATGVLLVFLVGWRGIAALTRRLEREPRED